MCLCTTERHANCFNYDFNRTSYDCQVMHDCQNNAQCFQDRSCPSSVICACTECFYGSKCQFTTKGFGLNLDAVLGYQIRPRVGVNRQVALVKLSLILTLVMLLIGVVSGTLSIMTFQTKRSRNVGCGIYLFSSAIVSSITMIFFALKFLSLLSAQMSLISNRTFFHLNCIFMDFLVRSLLAIGDWLNACVATERALMTIQGISFDKNKSKHVSHRVLISVVSVTFLSFLHDPIHRRLIDDFEEERTWCVVEYSVPLTIVNSTLNIIHYTVPFSINLISAILTIIVVARSRFSIHKQMSYRQYLWEQLQQHKHIVLSPLLLVLLSLPRIIISFISGCMKTARDPSIFLAAYFVSFIPTLLHFVVFVLPSKMYSKQLIDVFCRIRARIVRRQWLINSRSCFIR